MSPVRGRFLRDNAFLVAAVLLPILVVGLFLLASAIPRWTVPPPAYDLLFRASAPHDPAAPRVAVEFAVRDGQVEATVRGVPDGTYAYQPGLFLFNHETRDVRQVPFEIPEPLPDDERSRTVVVESLAGRHVLGQAQAPDGYELEIRSGDETGLVGALFGMSRYGRRLAIVNDGRAIPLDLPLPYGYRYLPEANAVGWIADEQPR